MGCNWHEAYLELEKEYDDLKEAVCFFCNVHPLSDHEDLIKAIEHMAGELESYKDGGF